MQAVHSGKRPPLTDRRGSELTSGGDNDIVLTLLEAGWEVGYRPRLLLTHLIPSGRTTKEYLARLNHAIVRSWVQVLDRHGIRPWLPIPRLTVWLRKLALTGDIARGAARRTMWRWRGACGQFEGQALLARS